MPMASGSSMCMKKTRKKVRERTEPSVRNSRGIGSEKSGRASMSRAVPTATSWARSSHTSQYPSQPTNQSTPTMKSPLNHAIQRERVKRRSRKRRRAWRSAKKMQASEL